MARIDLIDVGKTLTESGRRGGAESTFRIEHLSLRIPDGQTMVVLGPSGCGKTTLLRIIAGLIRPDSGEVRYDDVDVADMAPGARRIGMVFQGYALYPHFTSRKNVLSYFLFRKKTPELDVLARAKYQRTSELMGVELAYLLDRKPTTLSGGEKQRVALGRCITRDAALFLVDEPFANLDQALREKYRVNLKILLRQFSITTVYVTHDHHEALILADLVAVMDRGRIEQVGTPQAIYDEPKNVFVAGFLNVNIGTPPLSLIDASELPEHRDTAGILAGVRPEDVEITPFESEASLRGTVASAFRLPLRDTLLLAIRRGDQEIHAQISGGVALRPGDDVGLRFKQYHLFDKASGARLRSYQRPLQG
ncbi:MAG: ABC transporter ATP-binding protein [Candidatus Rokuibacteriota bacterium]|jgi:multiple sugar transport system ATP-binding protein